MGDPKVDVSKLSRRDFLKVAGMGALALTVPSQLLDAGLDLGLSFASKGMELQVPTEFKDIQIPERNKDYRKPEDIILEGLDLYESLSQKERLPRVHFEKGKEYLDFVVLSKKFPRLFEGEKYEDVDGFGYRLYGMIMKRDKEEAVKNADTPDIESFSAFSQNGVVDYIYHNPGSKIINQAQEYICKKYGWTRSQLISSVIRYDKNLPEVEAKDWDAATKIVANRLRDALEYLEERRESNGEPLSVSEAIAYFLYQNSGDLKESMWDTTFLLKVLARNDVDTLFSNNTFDKAETLAYLFKDEFSPRISHNWLTEQYASGVVPRESPLYLPGAMEYESGKNFMPINKSGTYYHAMNIMTWAATCMDPWVVKSIVAGYYSEQKFGGLDHRTEHGIDKVQADVEVAQSADRIKRTVDWYL